VKKISTAKIKSQAAKKKVTIGMDLGDRSSRYCLLDEEGVVIGEASTPTRNVRLIGESTRKDDRLDARTLARRTLASSACKPYSEVIELGLSRGRNAIAIWQDLMDDHGFIGRYNGVKWFVGQLRGVTTPEARDVIETARLRHGL